VRRVLGARKLGLRSSCCVFCFVFSQHPFLGPLQPPGFFCQGFVFKRHGATACFFLVLDFLFCTTGRVRRLFLFSAPSMPLPFGFFFCPALAGFFCGIATKFLHHPTRPTRRTPPMPPTCFPQGLDVLPRASNALTPRGLVFSRLCLAVPRYWS